jgi:hypothetical protein
VVVTVTQDVEDPFGIDGFCQDFGGHLSELLRRTVEALLVRLSWSCSLSSRGFLRVCIASSCVALRRSLARTDLAVMIGKSPH